MYIYIYIHNERTNDNCKVRWKLESDSLLELSLCQFDTWFCSFTIKKNQLSNKLGWLTF